MLSSFDKYILLGCCIFALSFSTWILNQVRVADASNDVGSSGQRTTKLVFGIVPILFVVATTIYVLLPQKSHSIGTQMSRRPSVASFDSLDEQIKSLERSF